MEDQLLLSLCGEHVEQIRCMPERRACHFDGKRRENETKLFISAEHASRHFCPRYRGTTTKICSSRVDVCIYILPTPSDPTRETPSGRRQEDDADLLIDKRTTPGLKSTCHNRVSHQHSILQHQNSSKEKQDATPTTATTTNTNISESTSHPTKPNLKNARQANPHRTTGQLTKIPAP